MSLAFRPDTNDAEVFEAVVARNEYRLPTRFRADTVVLDVGAHIGSFSYLALSRGAGHVYAFEPELSNFRQLSANLAGFGQRAHPANRALWRSDTPALQLNFWRSDDARNTGGGSVIWETSGPPVESIPLDDVIRATVQKHGRPIDLMKLDCEGAEFPILLTSRELSHVDRIVGEYHELLAAPPRHAQVAGAGFFTLARLRECLSDAGFGVVHEHQAEGPLGTRGLFFANRTLLGRIRHRLR